MNILEISKSSSAKTEFSFFFGFINTDVGVGFGFLKYRDIGFGFRLPTRLYSTVFDLQCTYSCDYRPGSTTAPDCFFDDFTDVLERDCHR